MRLFFQIYATFVIVLLFISVACYCISLIFEDKRKDIYDIMERITVTALISAAASLVILFFISMLIVIWE